MKAQIKILHIALLFFALVMTGCRKPDSPFALDGECDIVSLTLDDQYTGSIDLARRTVVVAIPEAYSEELMTLTALKLSAGATANVKVGDKLNLTAPRMISVTNGNTYQEFTLSVKHDEAHILSFVINGEYAGLINESMRTITVQIPSGTDLAHLTPTITVSPGATVTPAGGIACDFTHPVEFTVTYNTASTTYTVTVKEMGKPKALYVGLAATQQQLNSEEQAACTWLLTSVEGAQYASMADIAAGAVDMSECKVIWWHLHKDGGIDGKGQFENNAGDALLAKDNLAAYYHAGGNLLLTRFATYLPAYIGEADCVPNNCWGQNEENAETVSGPWEFSIAGHTGHPLWQNLLMNAERPENVFTCDAGYRITNSTAQYHIGTDWGGYDNREMFRKKTGAVDIAGGADAVVAWEYLRTAEHGAIICIGSGCYDWYSVAGDAGTEYYHANIAKITENAINYLIK